MSRCAGLGERKEIVSSEAGNSEAHKWPLFHIAGRGCAAVMRLVPRPFRFGAALLAARAAVPIVRRTEAFREHRASKVDGDLEIALHFVLSVLTKSGVTFDPLFVVRGYEEVSQARASGKGLLVICPHAALSLLLARLLHDNGLEAIVITADTLMRVGGNPR